jgi:murein DD-endopeptidase MepM/ murein hydrolase activator NlpD
LPSRPTTHIRPRLLAITFVVVALVVGSAALPLGPSAAAAGSGSSRSRLAQIQAREAQDRLQLNLAVASNNAVLAEILRLQRQVGIEQALVAADQSAAAAADDQVAAANRRLELLEQQGRAAHDALVARAVDLYEHPFQDAAVLLDGARTLDDVSTRQVLANAIQAKTSDVVDAVRAQQIEETAARRDLGAAQALAHSRHHEAVAEYARLVTAMGSQERAHGVLAARISDTDADLAHLTLQDLALTAQLNAEAARYAAALAAAGGGIGPVIGPVGSYGLQWPIHGVVTQEFGHNGHPGIDIAAAWGTPIAASGSGVVIYASWESGYGNYTCIAHGGGISTCYGHQSSIGVSVGQTVTRGEIIGREGSTGYSTGPHVHFEVRVDGAVRNPRLFIPGNP